MALFDIDHFKLFNDHYGHLAGDEALRQVAQCLDRFSRADESFYRYGGEEFLLLLPDCSVEGASIAARRLRTGRGRHGPAPRRPAYAARRGDAERRSVVLDAGLAEVRRRPGPAGR